MSRARRRRPNPDPDPVGTDGLVALWEALRHQRLRPARRADFLARPEATELAEYTEEVLRHAAALAIQKDGDKLLLSTGLAMCGRARLGLPDLWPTSHHYNGPATYAPPHNWT